MKTTRKQHASKHAPSPARSHHHRFAGILSAVGIHLADIVQEAQEPAAAELAPAQLPGLLARLDGLAAQATAKLVGQGFSEAAISVDKFLNLR